MKWVKHMTSTWDDEKIARLVKGGGVEGLAAYGLWWRVLEIVAGQMDAKSTSCSVTYDVSRWSLLLSLRGSHVRHWLGKMALTGLLTAEWDGTEIRVKIPKLLKYRDEYSKKSVHSPVQEGEQKEKENRTENTPIVLSAGAPKTAKALGWEGVRKTPDTVCDAIAGLDLSTVDESPDLDSPFMLCCRLNWFIDFWAMYWRADDKKSARVKYFEKVTSMQLKEEIEQAVIAQSPAMTGREKKYQPLAATWLNKERWMDSVEEESSQMVAVGE